MKKHNIYSKIPFILSLIIVPLSFFSVLDEMKIFRIISFVIAIVLATFGINSLIQKKKGKGYTITSIIISIIVLIFLILMSTTKPITYLEDKNEQNPLMTKVLIERAPFDIRIMDSSGNWVKTGIISKNISKIDIVINEDSSKEVLITLDEEGKKIFEKITNENIGKQVGIFVDDAPISTPIIREKITEGQMSILSSDLTDEELINFRARLLGYYYKGI